MNRQQSAVHSQQSTKTTEFLFADKMLHGVFLLLTAYCLLLCAVAPAYANVSKSTAELSTALAASNSELKPKQDGSVITIAELSPERHVIVSQKTVETPESLHSQSHSDNASVTAEDEQNTAATSNDNQDKNANAPLGISYESNETAIKAVDKKISLFKGRIKKTFSVWLERSARYVEIMQDILMEKGMPEELVFLPIVESGFNLHAYSRARAVGPWQFIASTGKRYGLVIDWWRDERKDPVKSTEAAADYLKDLYGMFGSWKLALAAYNAGEGRIGRAIKKANNDDFWHLKSAQKIPKETREYVPRYIAASMIASAPEEYGFHNLKYHEPLKYEEVTLHSPVDIDIIAQCAETTAKEIRELNPELRRWSTPPNLPSYTIKLPQGSKDIFIENLSKIPVEKRFSIDTYRVKKGDNLKKVAKNIGVPINVILAMNSMAGIKTLKAGEDIKIPPKGKYYADIDDKMSAKKVSSKKTSLKKSDKSGKKSSKKGGKTNRVKAKKI